MIGQKNRCKFSKVTRPQNFRLLRLVPTISTPYFRRRTRSSPWARIWPQGILVVGQDLRAARKRGSGPRGSLVLLSINQRRVISRVRQLHSGYFAGLPSSAPFVNVIIIIRREKRRENVGNLKVCFENEGFRWIIGSWIHDRYKLLSGIRLCYF